MDEAFAYWHAEIDARPRDRRRRPSWTRRSSDRGAARRYSLRWILAHMIEEYARHNGHADLLRERIDGATGD